MFSKQTKVYVRPEVRVLSLLPFGKLAFDTHSDIVDDQWTRKQDFEEWDDEEDGSDDSTSVFPWDKVK